jgi:hypothetical protein
LSIGNAWSFAVSGRYNRATIDNRDRIDPGGGPSSLDGQEVFDRLNPAAGAPSALPGSCASNGP